MARYAMTIDQKRCVTCAACVLACKAENRLPAGGFRDWIVQETRGRFPHLTLESRSERCHHCDSPPCVGCCPTGASHVSDGGAVIVSRDKCTGCKACIAACPYDARYVHPDGFVDKCTFCLHRVRKGQQPACVTICPTRALAFGDLADLASRPHKVLQPETGLSPSLYFLQ